MMKRYLMDHLLPVLIYNFKNSALVDLSYFSFIISSLFVIYQTITTVFMQKSIYFQI